MNKEIFINLFNSLRINRNILFITCLLICEILNSQTVRDKIVLSEDKRYFILNKDTIFLNPEKRDIESLNKFISQIKDTGIFEMNPASSFKFNSELALESKHGNCVLNKYKEYTILNYSEQDFLLNGIIKMVDNTIRAGLIANRDKGILGHISEISTISTNIDLSDQNATGFTLIYHIKDFLWQPILADCDCDWGIRIWIRVEVDKDSKLQVHYGVGVADVGLYCAWCPWYTLGFRIFQLYEIAQLKPLVDNTVKLFDDFGFSVKILDKINEIKSKTTLKNSLFDIFPISVKLRSLRFTTSGTIAAFIYTIGSINCIIDKNEKSIILQSKPDSLIPLFSNKESTSYDNNLRGFIVNEINSNAIDKKSKTQLKNVIKSSYSSTLYRDSSIYFFTNIQTKRVNKDWKRSTLQESITFTLSRFKDSVLVNRNNNSDLKTGFFTFTSKRKKNKIELEMDNLFKNSNEINLYKANIENSIKELFYPIYNIKSLNNDLLTFEVNEYKLNKIVSSKANIYFDVHYKILVK